MQLCKNCIMHYFSEHGPTRYSGLPILNFEYRFELL